MRRVFLTCAGLAWAACGGGDTALPDAAATPGDARVIPDATVTQDGGQPLSWVDFSITGCQPAQPPDGAPDAGPGDQPPDDAAPLDAGVVVADAGSPDSGAGGSPDAGMDAGPAPCRAHAPATLRFAAVAPAPIDIHVWEFGDDGVAGTAAPAHVYAQPGTYDVRLTVRGPGGTASRTRTRAVEIAPAALGGACHLDAQCSAGYQCVCGQDTGDGAACPANLASGMCSAGCGPAVPCARGVCAELAASAPDTPTTWQRSLCLLACAPDDACPLGLTCQDLPAGHGDGDLDGDGWVRACFAPGVLRPMGASCVDANGEPDHDLCAGGLCLDSGARGMCTAPCTPGTCPPSAACADLGDRSVCLARCEDASADCSHDPWLACEPAEGFTVDEPASPAGYCTARRCAGTEACGVDGVCVDGRCTSG